MRTRRTLFALLLLPALALAQDSVPRDAASGGAAAGDLGPGAAVLATGRYLRAALPKRADLVIHTPDLPALLRSATAAGLGDGKAWRTAFREQMQRWGARTGAPEALVAGAESMLAAADGEALLASLPLPPFEGPERATLFAFRSTHRAKALREALAKLIDGGLSLSYPGAPSEEQVGGRAVIALSGVRDRLYVLIQDGLVVASDHPLALGLFFRGLEQAGEPEAAGPMVLEVTHGRGDDAWTGWTYGERESVSWRSAASAALSAPLPAGLDPVVAVALPDAHDTPLFPVPAPSWLADLPRGGTAARLVALSRRGGFAVCGTSPAGATTPGLPPDTTGQWLELGGVWAVARTADAFDEAAARSAASMLVAGAATRLGWLRAWASGRVPPPIPGVEREVLLAPLTAAGAASVDRESLITWRTTDRPGELRGPRWHGPTTMLALRTLRDIATKTPPRRGPRPTARRASEPPLRTGGAVLPPPVPPRGGDDDGAGNDGAGDDGK